MILSQFARRSSGERAAAPEVAGGLPSVVSSGSHDRPDLPFLLGRGVYGLQEGVRVLAALDDDGVEGTGHLAQQQVHFHACRNPCCRCGCRSGVRHFGCIAAPTPGATALRAGLAPGSARLFGGRDSLVLPDDRVKRGPLAFGKGRRDLVLQRILQQRRGERLHLAHEGPEFFGLGSALAALLELQEQGLVILE